MPQGSGHDVEACEEPGGKTVVLVMGLGRKAPEALSSETQLPVLAITRRLPLISAQLIGWATTPTD
jgi:hypothetical protein